MLKLDQLLSKMSFARVSIMVAMYNSRNGKLESSEIIYLDTKIFMNNNTCETMNHSLYEYAFTIVFYE